MKTYKCDALAQPSIFFHIYMNFDCGNYRDLLAVHPFSLVFSCIQILVSLSSYIHVNKYE